MNNLPLPIEVETAPNPEFSVIWLHGLGADGNDFVPLVPELGLPAGSRVRFVFPHAPMIPVTCNNGYVMRAWYDILSLDGINRQVDDAGITASRTVIRELIANENRRGVATNRIVLAGFSQGGAMAYTAGLTHMEPLAGIMALSAYIPSPRLLTENANPQNLKTPIFVAHGTHDGVVPLQLGALAKDSLLKNGHLIEWHTYRMEHSVCQDEVVAIGQWLTARLRDG